MDFKTCGVTKLSGVLDLATCADLSKYICQQATQNSQIRKGGDPLAGVHRAYADPRFEKLLIQLLPLVEKATGLELWPTLSFCYHYTHGNVLTPHKDRSSCEIVAGICIGADPEYQQQAKTWPLLLKDMPEVDLNYGDMLIFRGHQTEHWREQFTGQWFVSAILGYVDKNGPFAFQKYDQRSELGAKHVGMTAWYWGVLRAKLKAILQDRY